MTIAYNYTLVLVNFFCNLLQPEAYLGQCTHKNVTKYYIEFTCKDSVKVCSWCYKNSFDNCPTHEEAGRKLWYIKFCG